MSNKFSLFLFSNAIVLFFFSDNDRHFREETKIMNVLFLQFYLDGVTDIWRFLYNICREASLANLLPGKSCLNVRSVIPPTTVTSL